LGYNLKILITLIFSLYTLGQSVSTTEVEAALIFRIAHFVEQQSTSVAKFCVFGDSEIYHVLKSNIENKMLGKRRVEVEITNNKNLRKAECSILILAHEVKSESDKALMMEVFGFVTISLSELNGQYSHIILRREDKKIKFDANLTKIKLDNVKISSKLLRLADRTY